MADAEVGPGSVIWGIERGSELEMVTPPLCALRVHTCARNKSPDGCSPASGMSPPGLVSTYKLWTASMTDGEVAQGTSPEVWGPNGSAEIAFSERGRAKEREGAGQGLAPRSGEGKVLQDPTAR